MKELPKVVIVGGGFAGLRCARKLRNKPVDITVIDRENHHLFQPLLYQVATAALSPGQIATPIRRVLGSQKNTTVLFGEVVDVDRGAQHVVLDHGDRVPYDYLVLAAGAETNYYGNEPWARHAHGLKDLRDAIRIRERVLLVFESAERETDRALRRQLLTFVVIGGGPTGVEMAGAISELGRQVLAADYRTIDPADIRVILLEMAPRVLTPFVPKLSGAAKRQLEELGVEVRLAQKVQGVDATGVRLDDGHIQASVVVWASGVRAVPLAEQLGTERAGAGQLVVDQSCALPGHPNIFAVGDIAYFVEEGAERPLPGVCQVAIQQGNFVADTILKDLRGAKRKRFRYLDKGIMATVGRSRAIVQSGRLRLTGFVAWLAWLFVHLFYLIGFRNRLIVLFEWAWAYLVFRRGARIITARQFPLLRQERSSAPAPLLVRAREPGTRPAIDETPAERPEPGPASAPARAVPARSG